MSSFADLMDRVRFALWRRRARVTYAMAELVPFRDRSTIPAPDGFVVAHYRHPQWTVMIDTGDPDKWLTVQLTYLGVTHSRHVSKVLANAHELDGRTDWPKIPVSVQSALIVWLLQARPVNPAMKRNKGKTS